MSTTDEQSLRAAYEACKLQAQIWKQEATTANATIAEIYQLCTSKTGEPGNWNGAEPVRAALTAAALSAISEPAAPLDARDALTVLRDLWQQVIFYQYSFPKGFMPRELGVRVNAVLDASPIARQAASPVEE